MGHREEFLKLHRLNVLAGISLPESLAAQYTPMSCLKEGRRSVYLVRDQTGWPAVVKTQPSGGEDSLRR